MAFFFSGTKSEQLLNSGRISLLHANECALCPLNHAPDLCHPKMEPVGGKEADIYLLGGWPNKDADEEGKPFSSEARSLIRRFLPASVESRLRWNNVVRCHTGRNKGKEEPTETEMEACRPSVIRDIEKIKPQAILGFGNIPLSWIIGEAGIYKWCGRRMPVQIGSHTCWYYPIMDPNDILEKRKFKPWKANQYGCDEEFAFAFHLRKALSEIELGLPDPRVYTQEELLFGLDYVTGEGGEADLSTIQDFLEGLDGEKVVGFDYETNAVRPYGPDAKLLSVALSGPKRALGIALGHKGSGWSKRERKQVFSMLREFLYRKHSKRVLAVHNAAFELEWSADYFGDDCLWKVRWGDSQGQAYILDERMGMLSLDDLFRQHFGVSIKDIDSLDRANLDDCPIESVLRYNALDARGHRMLYLKQDELITDQGLRDVYNHQVERTIAAVNTQVEGIPVDEALNEKMFNTYEKRRKKIEQAIADEQGVAEYTQLTRRGFNPASLYDIAQYLKVIVKMSHVGEGSLDAKTLEQIDDPVIKLILQWRLTNKILSTYIKPIRPGSSLVYNGVMHPIISTTKTRTWRTSSEHPNIQNWPKRTKVGLKARRQAYAGPDHRFVAFDFAGIQARNVAMESKDPTLTKYFWDHYDIHAAWANNLERLNPGWIEDPRDFKTYRYKAKNGFVFPSLFGAQPRSISYAMGVPEDIIAKLQDDFFSEFPEVERWQKRTIAEYYMYGYVTGLSGFRRRAPVRRNELINSPIQSDESIIVCDAWVRLCKLGIVPIMEIHDDLTFLWHKDQIDKNADIVIREMCRISFPWINLPLGVEMSVGEDWGTLETVGEFESKGTDNYVEIKK